MHVITHLSKLIKCTAPRVNPNVNYRLQVIMMCQHRFVHCNKYSARAGDGDSREAVPLCEERAYGNFLCFPLSFAEDLQLL